MKSVLAMQTIHVKLSAVVFIDIKTAIATEF